MSGFPNQSKKVAPRVDDDTLAAFSWSPTKYPAPVARSIGEELLRCRRQSAARARAVPAADADARERSETQMVDYGTRMRQQRDALLGVLALLNDAVSGSDSGHDGYVHLDLTVSDELAQLLADARLYRERPAAFDLERKLRELGVLA